MAAEVYQIPLQPDGKSYYNQPQSSSLRRSPPSSSNLFLGTSPPSVSPPSVSPPSVSPPSVSSSPKRSPFPPPPISDAFAPDDEPSHPYIADPSSAESSPSASESDFSSLSSWGSTRVNRGLTLDTKIPGDDGDDLDFPQYDSTVFEHSSKVNTPPGSDAPEPSTTTDSTQSNSPLPTPTVVDDTAVRREPSRHVDYLSHDWREEDIWASWRHIVTQRRVYGERSRLENASWRTWAKSKNNLRTLPPEKLNWLKESDVTWLYGPLKPASSHPITANASEPASHISKTNSFINKKPILKKRSMSEAMLQKSLSASSLVKQAAASVQAQQGLRQSAPHGQFGGPGTPFAFEGSSQPPSRDQIDYFSSRASSADAASTPDGPEAAAAPPQEKHIRFDEKVEQCIAVECKEGDLSDDEEDEVDSDDASECGHSGGLPSALSESSSDEGLVMMKRTSRPRRPRGRSGGAAGRRKKSDRTGSGIDADRASSQTRMIEEIEATTLKSRTDSPDVTQEAQHHVFGGAHWSSSLGSSPSPATHRSSSRRILSPSPSQETLRPSRPSRNFLLAADDDSDNDDDDDDDDSTVTLTNTNTNTGKNNKRNPTSAASSSSSLTSSLKNAASAASASSSTWSFGASNPKSSLGASSSPLSTPGSGGHFFGADDDLDGTGYYDGIEGMRRTASGMFMPYDPAVDEDGGENGSGGAGGNANAGLLGRVSETINTMRDIGHVLYTAFRS